MKKTNHKTVKKDVQTYISKDANFCLNELIKIGKEMKGPSVHKNDVLSKIVTNYYFRIMRKLGREVDDRFKD
jgi:hypothetical protein